MATSQTERGRSASRLLDEPRIVVHSQRSGAAQELCEHGHLAQAGPDVDQDIVGAERGPIEREQDLHHPARDMRRVAREIDVRDIEQLLDERIAEVGRHSLDRGPQRRPSQPPRASMRFERGLAQRLFTASEQPRAPAREGALAQGLDRLGTEDRVRIRSRLASPHDARPIRSRVVPSVGLRRQYRGMKNRAKSRSGVIHA